MDNNQKPSPNYVRHDLRKLFLVIFIIVVLLVIVKIIDVKTDFLSNLASRIMINK